MKKKVNRKLKYGPSTSHLNCWRLIKRYPEFPSEKRDCWYDIIRHFYGENFRGGKVYDVPEGQAYVIAKERWSYAYNTIRSFSKGRLTILEELDRLEKMIDLSEKETLDERICIQMEKLDDKDFTARDYQRIKGIRGYDPRRVVKRKIVQGTIDYIPI